MAEDRKSEPLADRVQRRLRLFRDYANILRDEISTINKQIYDLETTLLSQQHSGTTQISEGRSFGPRARKPIIEKRIFSFSSVTSPLEGAGGNCEKVVKGVGKEEAGPKPNAVTVHKPPTGRKRKSQSSARKPINKKRIFSFSSVTSPVDGAGGNCEKVVKGVGKEEAGPKPNAVTVHATPAGRMRKSQTSARKPINEKRIFSFSSVTSPVDGAGGNCETVVKGVGKEEAVPKPNAVTVHATPAGIMRKSQTSASKKFKI